MRPVKKRLMELNPDEEGESVGRYRRAVVEIGDHISSNLSQWSHSEERAQWRRYISLFLFLLSLSPSSLTCPLQELVDICVKVLQ